MTNRYVTEAEKAGHKRRMEAYLARLADDGISRRQLLLTDAETLRIKEIVECWRGGKNSLLPQQQEACAVLLPLPDSPTESVDR